MTTDPSNPSPLLNARIWSRLFFNWLSPLLKQGRLSQDDLYELPNKYNSLKLTEELEGNWLDEVKDPARSPSLLRATVRTIRRRVLLISLLMIPQTLVTIGQPLIIVLLMDFLDPCTTMSASTAWILVIVSILVIWIPCVFYHQHSARVRCFCMQMRTAFDDLIFRKMLRLSNDSMNRIGVDGIDSLVANDAPQIESALIYLDYLWVRDRGPFEIILIIGFFSYFVKYISLIALGYTIIVLLLQLLISRILIRLKSKLFQITNERVKILSEIVKSIRVVKMYCWESAFIQKVLSLRKNELIRYVHCAAMNSIIQTLKYTYTSVTFLLMYLTMWFLDMSLDTRVFALYSCLIGYLQYSVMDFLLQAIRNLIEYLAAQKRIQAFLLLAECKRDERSLSQPVLTKAKDQQENVSKDDPSKLLKISCSLKSAKWDENSTFALKNIVFEAHSGDLICIIGPSGSGKSSLLRAISGEITHFSGKIRMCGTCCYLPQDSWIFSANIHENIRFGQEYDYLLFKRIIHAVALDTDLSQLPHEAETIVGDQGVMLSESQKARVNLARALYRDADIYLLDDPISRVDTKLSKCLFERSVKGFLRDKICILVTHQVQVLKHARQIIELSKGEIVRIGTFGELLAGSSSFCRQLENTIEEEKRHRQLFGLDKRFSIGDISLADLKADEQSSILSTSSLRLPSETTEQKSERINRWHVYVEFVRAGVGLILGFLLFLSTYCLREGIFVYNNWWLAKWTDDENYRYRVDINCTSTADEQILRIKSMTNSEWKDQRNYRFHIYTALVCALFLVTLCRTIATQLICLNASRVLHNRMLRCIIYCPMKIFDTHPLDRILNCFTKDITLIDVVLPDIIHEFLHFAFYVLGTLALVGWINLWSLIAVGLAMTAMFFIRRRIARCLRDLRCIEDTTRGAIHSYLTSSGHGIKTIRSFRVEDMCSNLFRQRLEMDNRANHLIININRWAGLRLDWIACSFFTLIILSAMTVRVVGSRLSAAEIALTFSCAFNLVSLLQWAIRSSVDCQTQMVAVERILDYCSLERESPNEVPHDRCPPKDCADSGEIIFDNVSISHPTSVNAPLVLKNITLKIEGGEKIGIVGRTGAGKSSLVEALFHLRESISGHIKIDDIDIDTISLIDVRRRLAFIPQDPVLFAGTIRSNLDRFDEYSDGEIWHALEEVRLKNLVAESMPLGLQSEVSKIGSRLNVSQKQLIYLARAILKKNKILVMDEAIDMIDNETDKIIQQIIHEKFKNCTVLTIAHRLQTVIGYDRVMVLNHGELLEIDAPSILLNNPHSHLSSLVNQLGEVEFKYLQQLANIIAKQNDQLGSLVTWF
ncbi:unnamed protein product [Adineta ricciae]|uniref:Uncharacterized protein n=1 Tax=Adineta ricciae TaxID=249248 RepID=A0A814M3D4_ADIRI|nr:unnamed protein product [Adineta ricciae]